MNQTHLRVGYNRSMSGSGSYSDSGRSTRGVSASFGAIDIRNGHSGSRRGRVSLSTSLSKNGNHFRSWSNSRTWSRSKSKSKAH